MKKKNQKAVAATVATQEFVEKVPAETPATLSNRQYLNQLSKTLKPLVESGMFSSTNEALFDFYMKDEHQEFKSYDQWQAAGYQVKKGSKAFAIWGKPVKSKNENEHDYFPIAYVFSNAQVEPSKKEAQS